MSKSLYCLFLITVLSVCVATAQTAPALAKPTLTKPTQTGFSTPQAASKALFEAWRTKNRAKALQVATKEAVDKLFSVFFRTQRQLSECQDASDTEKGLYYCVYKDSEDDLLSVAFYMTKTKTGWRIREVSFSAEG